jgi:hypothetical protein
VLRRAGHWLERIDPRGHRRIKGLRLVTAYGIAAMLGAMADIERGLPDAASLAALAGGFALWASVSEGRATRARSSRDLLLLSVAAALGAAGFALLSPKAAARHGSAGSPPDAAPGPAIPEMCSPRTPALSEVFGQRGP